MEQKNISIISNTKNSEDGKSEDTKDIRLINTVIILKQLNFPQCVAKWAVVTNSNIVFRFKNVKEFEACFLLKDTIFQELKFCRDFRNSTQREEYKYDVNYSELKAGVVKKLDGNKLRRKKALLLHRNIPQCVAQWARINTECVSLKFESFEVLEELMSIIDIIESELDVCLKNDANKDNTTH